MVLSFFGVLTRRIHQTYCFLNVREFTENILHYFDLGQFCIDIGRITGVISLFLWLN
jgi:hypothetical protein